MRKLKQEDSLGNKLNNNNRRDIPEGSASLDVCVTGLSSDSHTWNLLFIQLLLEDLGHKVVNLGACVPDGEIVQFCAERKPQLLVISTVNGHGFHAAGSLIRALRDDPASSDVPVVIGGKLGMSGTWRDDMADELISAGYSAVFDESVGLTPFKSFVTSLQGRLPHYVA